MIRSASAGNPEEKHFYVHLLELAHPKMVLLVALLSISAMMLASDGAPLTGAGLMTVALSSGMATAGASVLSHYFYQVGGAGLSLPHVSEAGQTQDNPLGSIHRLSLLFGGGLAGIALILMVARLGLTPAAVTLMGVLYFLFSRHWLHPQNRYSEILLAASPAVFPVLFGWAVLHQSITLVTGLVAGMVVLWALHYQLSSGLCRVEYGKKRNRQMVIPRGPVFTRMQLVWLSLGLVILTLLPAALGQFSVYYFVAAASFGSVLVAFALRLMRLGTRQAATHLTNFSAMYGLLLLFLLMIEGM